MATPRRDFQRRIGVRRYRKLFVLATEGNKTEPEYFDLLQNNHSVIKVHCLKTKEGLAPLALLKKMEQYLKKESLKSSDEAWLVADRDQWDESQLDQLYAWSTTQKNIGFALSNPKFEYWLLLHFEEASGISSSRECSERLKRYLPEYDKEIDSRKITVEMITAAIRRAEQRDNNQCDNWPKETGTTVYRLVKNIFHTS
ncbi:MAG: RloB domain-containing protein [Chlorobium sp.]|nr:MAG: RloB domain-containing protein [Chlorobium sp.]